MGMGVLSVIFAKGMKENPNMTIYVMSGKCKHLTNFISIITNF